jgi:hypothetical protein
MRVQLHAFVTVALDGGEWSASRPGRFARRERASSTHWIGGWVGPSSGLDSKLENAGYHIKRIFLACGVKSRDLGSN